MKLLALFALASCTPAAPAPATPTTAATWPHVLHHGDTFDAILTLGAEHAYTIELAANDPLPTTLTPAADRECGNWTFAWHEPAGAWVTGNPIGTDPGQPNALDLKAQVADTGDLVGKAGTWTLKLAADPANCPRMPYRITVR